MLTMKLRNMTAIYIAKGSKMLMLYRQGGRVVNNVWIASAGGHFEEGELNDPKACVLRELREELAITEKDLNNFELRYITIKNTKGEIRQNYYYFAELKNSANEPMESNEGQLAWIEMDKLMTLEMPFTARYVVEHFLNEGRYNHKLYGGITNKENVFFLELPQC